MVTIDVVFNIQGKSVTVVGHPELEGLKGFLIGEGMALFFGHEHEVHFANTKTGKMRKFVTPSGQVLIEDKDVDIEAIEEGCIYGVDNAKRKAAPYALLNRWDNFKCGLNALVWTLYPDGRFFADSDGFGMEDNEEEVVYAIIDSDLNIIEPFRPMENVDAYLKKLVRQAKKQNKTDK